MRRFIHLIILLLTVCAPSALHAQVGEYRNIFSVGGSAGYLMNTMGLQPTVVQQMHGGMSFGVTGRYTSEKYFSTLCAIQAEVNIAQLGWTQDILTIDDAPVINPETGVAEEYQRDITYVQIPIFAHLSWGKERKGLCAFFNIGPQIGFMLSDKTKKNYNKAYTRENFPENFSNTIGRVSLVNAQEDMPVENKFDFGIMGGLGVEWHLNKVGRFSLEARYYYGLGNIYGDSKRDFFGASNHSTIAVKLGYLCDL